MKLFCRAKAVCINRVKSFIKLFLYEALTLNRLDNSAKKYNCVHGYHSLDRCFLHFNYSKILVYRYQLPL